MEVDLQFWYILFGSGILDTYLGLDMDLDTHLGSYLDLDIYLGSCNTCNGTTLAAREHISK